MAFIDKKDPVVLNIKLTSKGREQLSKGNFNFKYFVVGDSEINYSFIKESNINSENILITRPIDNNPKILSPILEYRTSNIKGLNNINNITSIPSIIENSVNDVGFFYYNNNELMFNVDEYHIKQPDVLIKIDEITGGSILNLYKSNTYVSNVNEPNSGDFLIVKWTNPAISASTTGYTVNNIKSPILIYKITNIISGDLFNNNLIVSVDRDLPNFIGITGNTGLSAGAMILYGNIVDKYSTEYLDDAVLSFYNNSQCNITTFPFWKLSLVYLDDIVGVGVNNKKYFNFKTNIYSGFVSYIQNQNIKLNKIGIIHYTNNSPDNYYGEEFFQNTPQLTLPTVMWHKAENNLVGLTLKPIGGIKTLTGETISNNCKYYDLGDNWGNIVGKVLIDYKIFIIEDQELLFAMSYKSNRNWTLPNYVVGINDSVVIGCVACYVTCSISSILPSRIGTIDGKLIIDNIDNNIGNTVLEIKKNDNNIFYNKVTGYTEINNLIAGDYIVNLYDLGSPNCVFSSGVTINNPTSKLKIYDIQITTNGLNKNFIINQNTSTSITVPYSGIGKKFGEASVGYKRFGVNESIVWQPINSTIDIVNINSFTFKTGYEIYINDSGITPTIFNHSVSKVFLAKGNPLNQNFSIVKRTNVDGSVDVRLSNYLLTLNNSINPIMGKIQYKVTEYDNYVGKYIPPFIWNDFPNIGSSIFIPITGNGDFEISIREYWNNNTVFIYSKIINISNNTRIN